MAYTNRRNGFNIQTNAAVDKRIYLTKAEMRAAESLFLLPDSYFAICANDGKLYLYNVDNEENPETGKYRLFEGTLDEIDGGEVKL